MTMPTPTYREQVPPAALRPWVECAWELVVGEGDDHIQRVLPDGSIDLVWTEHAGLRVVGPNTTAFLEPVAAGSSAVGVRLHPGAAPPLVGGSAEALRDARVPAGLVWRAAGARLEDAAAGAAGADERLGILLGAIAARSRGAPGPDGVVGAVVARLRHAPTVRAGELAADLGLGERQLRRRVVAAVGYGPKRLARVLRLQRALAAARAGQELAAVAYEAGYADQSHFARDCSELAGVPPTHLAGPFPTRRDPPRAR